MVVVAVSSWVPEGVLNNIVEDDLLLWNYPDCWQSLLKGVCSVENVSQFTWARLVALLEERPQQAC